MLMFNPAPGDIATRAKFLIFYCQKKDSGPRINQIHQWSWMELLLGHQNHVLKPWEFTSLNFQYSRTPCFPKDDGAQPVPQSDIQNSKSTWLCCFHSVWKRNSIYIHKSFSFLPCLEDKGPYLWTVISHCEIRKGEDHVLPICNKL